MKHSLHTKLVCRLDSSVCRLRQPDWINLQTRPIFLTEFADTSAVCILQTGHSQFAYWTPGLHTEVWGAWASVSVQSWFLQNLFPLWQRELHLRPALKHLQAGPSHFPFLHEQ